jgi:hypothetical protein
MVAKNNNISKKDIYDSTLADLMNYTNNIKLQITLSDAAHIDVASQKLSNDSFLQNISEIFKMIPEIPNPAALYCPGYNSAPAPNNPNKCISLTPPEGFVYDTDTNRFIEDCTYAKDGYTINIDINHCSKDCTKMGNYTERIPEDEKDPDLIPVRDIDKCWVNCSTLTATNPLKTSWRNNKRCRTAPPPSDKTDSTDAEDDNMLIVVPGLGLQSYPKPKEKSTKSQPKPQSNMYIEFTGFISYPVAITSWYVAWFRVYLGEYWALKPSSTSVFGSDYTNMDYISNPANKSIPIQDIERRSSSREFRGRRIMDVTDHTFDKVPQASGILCPPNTTTYTYNNTNIKSGCIPVLNNTFLIVPTEGQMSNSPAVTSAFSSLVAVENRLQTAVQNSFSNLTSADKNKKWGEWMASLAEGAVPSDASATLSADVSAALQALKVAKEALDSARLAAPFRVSD